MPANKNAMRRYLVLDLLFRSGGHTIDELMDELEERLHYSVGKNTVLDDIAFMESSEGWNIELERRQYGHKKLLLYRDPSFSIMNMPLTQEQARQLRQTIDTLSGIKGLPKFGWLEPLLATLKEKFAIDGTPKGTVALEQCERLQGLEWFGQLFEAIVAGQVVELRYHRFGRPARTRTVMPYQLKQYNNRWYVVGCEPEKLPRLKYVVVPIDRIVDLSNTHAAPSNPHAALDAASPKTEGDSGSGAGMRGQAPEGTAEAIREHFTHIVGVSLLPEGKPVTVRLKAWKPDAWYIDTKPIHWSQKMVQEEKEWMVFELEVIPNEELVQQLLTYANRMEVLEPLSLREELYTRAQKTLELNKPQE